MSRKPLRPTGRKIVGYDHSMGKVVRRSVYADSEGSEYVAVGSYGADSKACVSKAWFCKHILNEEYITRGDGQ